MPKLTIDGTEIEVAPGTSILQACEQMGVEIPRFCYHDKLSVPANCRMCLVEVTPGPPKPAASCAMACADGMAVKTNSEMVKKARKGVMEMLLINHPLDCPICDQGGECDLQDQAMGYGFDRSRYAEEKRAVKDKELGPLVKTVMTRCIQCTRCVRFGEEIAGTPDLGFLYRGENVEIGTFVEKAASSELSGNMIDICPVGALTNKPYAFKARPWELKKTETIDAHDAVGSNIRVDTRGNEVMRVLPRLHEDVNEEWISDKARFACDGLKFRRLDRPWLRKGGKLTEVSWDEALTALAGVIKKTAPDRTAVLAGDLCAVEDMVSVRDLLGSQAHYTARLDGAQYDVSTRGNYLFNATIAGLEQADAILLVAANPRHEATMVNARIRKTWLANRVKVGVIGPAGFDLTYPCQHLGAGPQDLSKAEAFFAGARNPAIIAGMGAFIRADGLAVHAALLALADKCKASFNMLHTAAGRVGALDIGFYSRTGFNLPDMDLLWLLGVDDIPPEYIPASTFVVYQGHHGEAGAARADLILPGAAYTEKDGLYVNMEGRVQSTRRAADPPGQAKADWTIARAVSETLGRPLSYKNLGQLRARIAQEWPHLGRLDEIAAGAIKPFAAPGTLAADPLMVTMDVSNYYLTNAICRASPTMGKCVEAFVKTGDQKVAA